MMMTHARPDYASFLDIKRQHTGGDGFVSEWRPDFLFDFQHALVDWAQAQGRAAIFADCGLGKTPMQLVWSENVVRHTGGRVLIVTPLAVSHQTIRESEKFGIGATRSDDGTAFPGITVTNYERLHLFNPRDFVGTACDESSAIKSFDGKRRQVVTDFMRRQRYRLLSTATAAPNDYIELGTSSEALGYLGHIDMLGKFFKNDQNTVKPVRRWTAGQSGWGSQASGGDRGKWRLKGHAEDAFWRWVASWARAMRRPSDLGFDDARFVLPALTEREHLVEARTVRPGMLFDMPAVGLWEEREEARRTIAERCERAAGLVNGTGEPAVVWCHLNDEGDQLARLIPDAVQVAGSDSDQVKEDRFLAFSEGRARVLITKPKIGAWGLNWQHCAHMVFFVSHSFESYYQGVRRCWRFGQTRPVTVDVVTTEGGRDVMANLQRKAAAADAMFSRLTRHMNDALSVTTTTDYQTPVEVPAWLS